MSKLQIAPTSTVQPLDKNGFIPLYYQIQRALMEKIHSRELSEGDPLASEEELARAYRVSRMTARQALHGLKTSGYAVSQKGRGTFVTRPKLEKSIMHLMGFTEDMKQRGMVPSSKLMEQSVVHATDDVAEKLKVRGGRACHAAAAFASRRRYPDGARGVAHTAKALPRSGENQFCETVSLFHSS